MIGNDIVDLARAKQESNWQRRGFLDKVFTEHEQHLIHTAPDPGQIVWLLWSMKESAYKLSVRHTNKRVLAPRKITCFLNEISHTTQTGHVVYEDESYETQSIVTPEYIATMAFRTGTSPVYHHCIVSFDKPDYLTQHRTIREHIKQDYAVRLSVSEQQIRFHKDKVGIPYLTVRDSQPMALTISHHGYYGAYGVFHPTGRKFTVSNHSGRPAQRRTFLAGFTNCLRRGRNASEKRAFHGIPFLIDFVLFSISIDFLL